MVSSQLHISTVETHGTGTPLGDPIEVSALQRAVMDRNKTNLTTTLGAYKSQIGHAEGAAGMAGMVKALQVLQYSSMPPNLHHLSTNPKLELENCSVGLYSEVTQMPADMWALGGMGVSSFGFSGTNAHVIFSPILLQGRGNRDRRTVDYLQTPFLWRSFTPRITRARNGYFDCVQPSYRCVILKSATSKPPRHYDDGVDELYQRGFDVLTVDCPAGPVQCVELAAELSSYSDIPCILLTVQGSAEWACELIWQLQTEYTPALPVLLWLVNCAVPIACLDRAQTLMVPFVEVWTEDAKMPRRYESKWHLVAQAAESMQQSCSRQQKLSRQQNVSAARPIAAVLASWVEAQKRSVTASNTATQWATSVVPAESEIVIVGAGLAGLTIEKKLRLNGFKDKVCVLERSQQIGGVWLHQANGEQFLSLQYTILTCLLCRNFQSQHVRAGLPIGSS